jgi:hypothetical protein
VLVLIVATAGLLLVQDTPPVVAEFRVVVVPEHTTIAPVIGEGAAVTVTTVVA